METDKQNDVVEDLGLAGDGDDCDMLDELEQGFGITIEDTDAEKCETVGDLFDIVLRHAGTDMPGQGVCASARAFYRLRAVLGSLTTERLGPSFSLKAVSTMSPRDLLEHFSKETGLRLPLAPMSGVGCLGVAIGIGGLIATVCLLNDHEYLLAAVSVGVGLTFAAVLLWLDDGEFPNACETLGDLANYAAAMNVKSLRETGACYRREDLWQAMRFIVSEHLGLAPEAIGRTTRFFPE